jgi:hypothetical protein
MAAASNVIQAYDNFTAGIAKKKKLVTTTYYQK